MTLDSALQLESKMQNLISLWASFKSHWHTHTHAHTHTPHFCAYLPFICLRGAPPALSWARQRPSTLRKTWKEVAERYSWACCGDCAGSGLQQLRAWPSRARGVRATLPRPHTPSQGTLNEALCRPMEENNKNVKKLVNLQWRLHSGHLAEALCTFVKRVKQQYIS